jgi:hypothetical protein
MLDATSISKQPKKLRFSNESVFLATLVLATDTWRFLASLMLPLQSITELVEKFPFFNMKIPKTC